MQPPRESIRRPGLWTMLLPLLGMGGIWVLSSIPGGKERSHSWFAFLPEWEPWFGNFLHVPVYAVLALSWQLSLEGRLRTAARGALLAIFLTTLYGVIDEFHQSFTPGRTPSALDVGLDFTGAVLAAWSWPLIRRLFYPLYRRSSS